MISTQKPTTRNQRRRQNKRKAAAEKLPNAKNGHGSQQQMVQAPLAKQYIYRSKALPSHTVSANEIAGQITVSSAGDFNVQNFALPAPGLTDTFGKFLVHPSFTAMGKAFAGMYRKYRYKSYKVIYQPAVPTTQPGQITLFYVGNPSEVCPQNLQSVSAQTLSLTGPVWQEVCIDLLEHSDQSANQDPVQRLAQQEVRHEIESTKYRWCDLTGDQAPGMTYAGYWGVAVSATDLVADVDTGEVKPKNFGNIRIQWEVEFYEAHPQNSSINGATYVATGDVDSTTGNFVFNNRMSDKASDLVWPVSRMGNVGQEIIDQGGKNAPVITLGQANLGYMIQINYAMTQQTEQPTLSVVDPNGQEYDLTGTLYTATDDGYTANTVFLVSEKTLDAIQQTLGIELGGKFWKWFKGACRVVLKNVVAAAQAVLEVAPLIAPLLAYHEARWASFHPQNLCKVKKTMKHSIVKPLPVDPFTRMIAECKASEAAKMENIPRQFAHQHHRQRDEEYPDVDQRGPQDVKRRPDDRSSSNQSRYQKF